MPVQDLIQQFKEPAIWGLSNIGSAILGAIAMSVYHRAKPRITIDNIDISSINNELYDDDKPIPIPQNDVIRQINHNEWLYGFPESSLKAKEFTKRLEVMKGILEAMIQALEKVSSAIDHMYDILEHPRTQGIAEQLFDVCQAHQFIICRTLLLEITIGTYSFPKESEITNDKEGEPETWYEDEHQFLIQRDVPDPANPGKRFPAVFKRGALYWIAPLAGYPYDEINERAAKAFCCALAYFDVETMRSILDIVKQQIEKVEIHRQLHSLVTEMINSYSRWGVMVSISNYGRSPITFSGCATMFVETKGIDELPSELAIELQYRNEEGKIVPQPVAGRESKVIRYTSANLVMNAVANWKNLYKLFDIGNSTMSMSVTVTPSLWSQGKVVMSPNTPFRRRIHESLIQNKGLRHWLRQLRGLMK